MCCKKAKKKEFKKIAKKKRENGKKIAKAADKNSMYLPICPENPISTTTLTTLVTEDFTVFTEDEEPEGWKSKKVLHPVLHPSIPQFGEFGEGILKKAAEEIGKQTEEHLEEVKAKFIVKTTTPSDIEAWKKTPGHINMSLKVPTNHINIHVAPPSPPILKNPNPNVLSFVEDDSPSPELEYTTMSLKVPTDSIIDLIYSEACKFHEETFMPATHVVVDYAQYKLLLAELLSKGLSNAHIPNANTVLNAPTGPLMVLVVPHLPAKIAVTTMNTQGYFNHLASSQPLPLPLPLPPDGWPEGKGNK